MKFIVVRQSAPEEPQGEIDAATWEEARALFRRRAHLYDDECLRRKREARAG